MGLNQLEFARMQMAMTLGFHIVFAAIGIALPLGLFIVEALYLRTKQKHYLELALRWAKIIGFLFAIGAVSGTALSFELGLLWPRYMAILGPSVGHMFALEGFAFFIEAIFIGLYLYGRDRMSPIAHWLTSGVIALSGVASGILVLAVNAWMQVPVGFSLDAGGNVVATDPFAILRSYAWVVMSIHSTLACYSAVPILMAGLYGYAWLRGRRSPACKAAILICMAIGGIASIVQPFSGDMIAKFVYRTQPAKFAALESQFRTMIHAPIHLGGMPDPQARVDRDAIEIPGMLSFLAAGNTSAKVIGLDDIPRDRWPNIPVVHLAFDTMVACGSALALISALFWFVWFRRGHGLFETRWLLCCVVAVSPLGIVALEAGWIVTEVGRQPWIIQGVMLTRDAVTPTGQVPAMFFLFLILYLVLGGIVIHLLRQQLHAPMDEIPAESEAVA